MSSFNQNVLIVAAILVVLYFLLSYIGYRMNLRKVKNATCEICGKKPKDPKHPKNVIGGGSKL